MTQFTLKQIEKKNPKLAESEEEEEVEESIVCCLDQRKPSVLDDDDDGDESNQSQIKYITESIDHGVFFPKYFHFFLQPSHSAVVYILVSIF